MTLTPPTFCLVTADVVAGILEEELAAAKDLVGAVYRQVAGGGVVNPPSLFLRPDPGRPERFIALPAAVAGPSPAVGVKWIGSFPGNLDGGLPRASAVIVLNDPETGFPLACLEGSVISAARTALSAVVGAETLCGRRDRREAGLLGVVGAGVIARRTVATLLASGWRLGSVQVFDLRPEQAADFTREVASAGVECRAVGSPGEALAGTDLVLVATTATTPWFDDPALTRPGVTVLHLSLRDLTAETMAACDHVVDDPDNAVREGTSLELAVRHAGLAPEAIRPIGELLAGAATRDPGRAVVYSPFGLGALDVVLADLVLRRARHRGLVVEVPAFFGASSDASIEAGGRAR